MKMDISNMAPCGLNCALCLGFQREKNRCGGCLSETVRPGVCARCVIKFCPEKNGVNTRICGTWCAKYPCARLKHLDLRYRTKYGESCLENITLIEASGIEALIVRDSEKWKCPVCGELLCCHKPNCIHCGGTNPFFIGNKAVKNL